MLFLLLNDGEGIDFAAVRDVSGAGWQDAVFTPANVFVYGELVGVRRGLDGVKLHFIAVGAAGRVEDSAVRTRNSRLSELMRKRMKSYSLAATPSGM